MRGVHNDFDVLASKMSTYSDIDFIYLALDRDISREQIESARNSEEMFNKMRSDLCCNLWRGGEAPIRALVYDTKRYRDGLLSLAREVYLDAEFNRTIESLTPLYKKSAEDIRQKLVKTPPLELASEIKGKNVADNQSFKQYYFIPSYFLHDFNISAWEAETSIFMLFYSVKTSERIDHEEIDRFLSLLKSLSDRTRLQILQKLRTAPSYGKKLAEELNLSTASISRQLDQLRTMKLITEEKSDNFKYFRINRNEIDQLIKSIQEFFSEE